MKISFYIPKYEIIPTELRLKVDENVDVYYKKLPDKFGYEFSFLRSQGITLEEGTAIVDEIVNRMKSQSYDHGVEWRESAVREIIYNEHEFNITVFFRIRDAW